MFAVIDITPALRRKVTCSQCNPGSQLEQQEAVDQVMQHVRGRTDLEETVVAIYESNGGPCPTGN